MQFLWKALKLEAVVLLWPQEEFGSGLQLQGVVAAPIERRLTLCEVRVAGVLPGSLLNSHPWV